MGDPLEHAKSSAEKFGGEASDYIEIHKIMDSSKLFLADWRHRSVLHNTFGIYLMEEYIIGPSFTRESDGEEVCTRTVCTQHIMEDLNMVPTLGEFLREMPLRRWMQQANPDEIRRMKEHSISDEAQALTPVLRHDRYADRVQSTVVWRNDTPPVTGYYLVDSSCSSAAGQPVLWYDNDETPTWHLEPGGEFVEPEFFPRYWAKVPVDPILDEDEDLEETEDYST